MDDNQPKRLLNEHYLSQSSPFRIFRHRIDGAVEVHWHEFFEMALVLEGSGTHVLNGKSMPLEAGSLFLVTPADFHEIIPDPGRVIVLYDVVFTQHMLRQELFQWLFQSSTERVYDLNEQEWKAFRAEFDRMWEESEQRQTGSDWVAQGALERVLIDLARLGTSEGQDYPAGGHLHPSIRAAVTYIQHHFREPLTLHHVARHAGLSDSYFSECFRKQLGLPFQVFVQEQRLQFASSLLRLTELPVTEVCFASGFRTLNHFERAFKKKYNRTPRELRGRKRLQSVDLSHG
ncbi:helix-turn-helix domain-containing protein [Paenibacillus dokdonensis]|uniref:helix-turn-helix domain-containing protein n=1 Tax=Paenibacillus dokdonensis TaxID=2567944 RepID=UPI0010A93831|nr:AraC family transcriptional regulator [Paenibacillus dokdonensis]